MTSDMIVKGMRVAGKASMSPESSEFTPPGASYIITAIFPFKEKNWKTSSQVLIFQVLGKCRWDQRHSCVKWRNIVAHTHHPELCIWIIHLHHGGQGEEG